PGPEAAAKTAVHVTAQKTWLQPVSPVFIPGLNQLAAANRAAVASPHAEAKILAPEVSAPEQNPSPASTSMATVGAADFGENAIDSFEDSNSAPATRPAAATQNSSAIPLAAAPCRDLEINMAPRDL